MKVLITGGTGRVGTPVSEKFVENGWDVNVIGAEPDSSIDGINYTHCDITDYEAVFEAMAGCEAVVHLAAIPSPRSVPSHQLFHINVTGTANIYEAAANHGIKRVVQASSINAIGSFWGCDDRQFDYFPLDENHSRLSTDPYSQSKQLGEDIAAYHWRRDGISGASFRFPAVWTESTIHSHNLRDNLTTKRGCYDDLIHLPESEQKDIVDEAWALVRDFRDQRMLEYDARQAGIDREHDLHKHWLASSILFDAYNCWAYVHTSDTTQAIEKALITDYDGSHPLFINSDVNYLSYDSEALLRLIFPTITARSKSIEGMDALVSCDRAYQLIGFEPTFRFIVADNS